ncbi:MAG: asparagine synthase (glutamine-hydrolyzing), partial [Thermodesulfobacteriota bacterium]
MCGIYGIVSASLPEDEISARLMRMGRKQRHRGPDGQEQMVRSGAWGKMGMGLVRLAILDLVTGMQPIVSTADNTAIACNGQIYNYLELRRQVATEPFVSRGDIEVALHLYRKKGMDFLDDLNGMYAGAIYDPVRQRILLFRDRFGIKPLYYTVAEDGFAFSSEIKPLFAAVARNREINQKRLATYFTYRYVPGGDTLFKGICRVPPGAFLLYDLKSHSYEIHRYWDYHLDRVQPEMSIQDAAARFDELFSDAVSIRLRSDVELGSFISGGIDSSAVSSAAASLHPMLRLFTIAFREAKYDELPQVKQFLAARPDRFAGSRLESAVCSRDHLNQLPAIVRALEEPISLGTIVPTDQVCQLAGRRVKAVLTGEGADEIFAGYRKFMIEMAAQEFETLPARQQLQLLSRLPELKGYLS